MISNPIICKFFKDFTNHRKKTNRTVVFICSSLLNILKYRDHPMKPSNNLENKTPLESYWRVQLLCKKVQGRSSLEPPLEFNQDQIPLTNQGFLWPSQPFWELQKYHAAPNKHLEGKQVTIYLSHQFLEKFSANNFVLSDAEDNTFRPLNRGGIADLLW